MTGPGRTLRDVAASADARRFVGREAELQAAAELLDPHARHRVLFLHGPGGIGKSATLRAIGRQAEDHGFTVLTMDPRSLAEAFDRVLDRALDAPAPRTLVIIDEVQALGSRIGTVRDRLLDALPDTARLVMGGREGPDPSWRAGGLDAIVVDLALGPLTDLEADALLAERHIAAPDRPAIVAWAQGSPLALWVAAAAPGSGDGGPSAAALEARLTAWLTGRSILDVAPEVLEVAAIAPAVDARLLAAALPARPTRQAMRELEALPVVERVGERLVLHTVLAAAVRARLQTTAPERARTLTRRIVEQLAARARLGDMQALVELSQLISDPHLRMAVANQPSTVVFTSHPVPGERASFAGAQGFDRGPDWPELDRWAFHGFEHELCVRRRDGSMVMHAAFTRVDRLPELGPVTSSLAAAAELTAVDAPRSYAGIVLFADGTEHERIEAARIGSGALMHQHGVADMQAVLIHYPPPDRRPIDAIAAIATDVPGDLDRAVALSDFRPHGVVGFVEQIVLGELGVTVSRPDARTLLSTDDDPERQDQLRLLLDQTFGSSPHDQRLRAAIELAHLGPRRSERECLNALHVSRSTWFRLLRQARERVLGADPI